MCRIFSLNSHFLRNSHLNIFWALCCFLFFFKKDEGITDASLYAAKISFFCDFFHAKNFRKTVCFYYFLSTVADQWKSLSNGECINMMGIQKGGCLSDSSVRENDNRQMRYKKDWCSEMCGPHRHDPFIVQSRNMLELEWSWLPYEIRTETWYSIH